MKGAVLFCVRVSSAEGSIQGSLKCESQGRLETYVSTSEMAVAHIGDSVRGYLSLSLVSDPAMDPGNGEKGLEASGTGEKCWPIMPTEKRIITLNSSRRSNTGSSF